MSKISELKKCLNENNLDFLLIPMRDEFGCEYVPPQGKRIEFLTEFKGSNAFVIANKEKSAFFTDGRYTLQAAMEVNQSDFDIFEMAEKDQLKWLEESAKEGSLVGYNPEVFSISEIAKFQKICDSKNLCLKKLEADLIDKTWQSKPSPQNSKAFKIAPETRISEISFDSDFLFETDPENVNWLLNIRGQDLAYTPVILCYLLLSKNGEPIIFTDNSSVADLGFNTKNISVIENELRNLKGKSVQINDKNCPEKYREILEKNESKIIYKNSPINFQKAIKSKTELDNIQQAHIIDGVAVCLFFKWLEKQINNNKLYTEFELSEQLSEFRKKHPAFYSLSFDVISGFKDNGAIIHYRAEKETAKNLEGEGMFLVDSGAQYYAEGICGTTDITRTIYIGEPSAEHKKTNTLVLKGHIAIANSKFKKGTTGCDLDVLARQFLKAEGLNYKHGTGHGVGYFLNVHEGPHGISAINKVPLEEGMVISNEPGYYKEGEYGIRIESLVYVKKSQEEGFLEFETLTKAPIDLNLVDCDILSEDEKIWLNGYHKNVYEQLSEHLNADEKIWLKEKTKEI